MGKRKKPEEGPAEPTSEESELPEATASEGGTVVGEVESIPMGRPMSEGTTVNPVEAASNHLAPEEMPGVGPFWDLLMLAGYKPW